MGRIYTVSFSAVAVTVAQDLFEGLLPADMCVSLHEVKVTQSSDAGDAASEQIRVSIRRVVGPTPGSGGSSPTPAKHQTGDVVSTVGWEANNTTQSSGGTNTLIIPDVENVHNGVHYLPIPEDRIMYSPAEYILVELEDAPADSLTMSGYLTYEEIGG